MITNEEHCIEETISPTDNFPPVMNVDQVAAYLQVGKRTIYTMAAAGEMPAAKVGEQWRFYRPEIDRWLIRLTRANVGDTTPVEEGEGLNGEV